MINLIHIKRAILYQWERVQLVGIGKIGYFKESRVTSLLYCILKGKLQI